MNLRGVFVLLNRVMFLIVFESLFFCPHNYDNIYPSNISALSVIIFFNLSFKSLGSGNELSHIESHFGVNATRFSIIADTTSVSLGNMVSETVAANQIISKFNSAFEWLTENEVPEEEQIIFVSPSVMTLIRNSTELTKFLTQGDYRAASGIDFTVEKYGGRPIIEVPSNRFFTNVLVTNNGYRPQTSSKVINYMVVSAKAVIPSRHT